MGQREFDDLRAQVDELMSKVQECSDELSKIKSSSIDNIAVDHSAILRAISKQVQNQLGGKEHKKAVNAAVRKWAIGIVLGLLIANIVAILTLFSKVDRIAEAGLDAAVERYAEQTKASTEIKDAFTSRYVDALVTSQEKAGREFQGLLASAEKSQQESEQVAAELRELLRLVQKASKSQETVIAQAKDLISIEKLVALNNYLQMELFPESSSSKEVSDRLADLLARYQDADERLSGVIRKIEEGEIQVKVGRFEKIFVGTGKLERGMAISADGLVFGQSFDPAQGKFKAPYLLLGSGRTDNQSSRVGMVRIYRVDDKSGSVGLTINLADPSHKKLLGLNDRRPEEY